MNGFSTLVPACLLAVAGAFESLAALPAHQPAAVSPPTPAPKDVQCDGCTGFPGPVGSDIGDHGTINIAVSQDHGECTPGTSGCDKDPCRPTVTIWWTLDGTYTGSVCVNAQCKPKTVSGTDFQSKVYSVDCGDAKNFFFDAAGMSVGTSFFCSDCTAQ